MNHCYVGGYWYGRAETKESCVARASGYFARLGAHDASLGEWLGTSDTLREALAHVIKTDPESLGQEFESSQHGRTHGGPSPGEGVHSLHAWNGELFGHGALCDLDCGGASIWSSGLALLRLPRRGPAASRLCTITSVTELLKITVEQWEPEWAVATARELRDQILTEDEPPRPVVGWVTYASRAMARALPELQRATVEPFAGGHLITLADSRPPDFSPELAADAKRIDAQLRKARLLTSTRERAGGKP
ncbi:MAG TPA: Imm52 family immunity protein [Myxococcaceae bacterium]|nr:Imm52 family immunity protein [Myxococcaceae bacterium]